MLRALALPLLTLAASAPLEAAQDPDPHALLEAAAEAARSLSSGTYQARSSVTNAAGAGGTLSGEVRFSALEAEDALGAKLFVRAKAPDATGVEIPFELAYDGQLVRGRLGEEPVVWYSPLSDAGGELLEVGEQLLMEPLFAQVPFGSDLEEAEVSLGGELEVGGVNCREVIVEHGVKSKITWALSLEDHLPRRRVGEVHRRGVFQTETLEITELKQNVGIHASVFTIRTPTGYESKPFVSRRPKYDLLPIGSAAPEVALRDPEGGEFSLAARRGKVVVLDFWATWCAPCRQSMPQIQKLQERFADNERVEIWGLATQERAGGDPAGFMKQGGFTYGLLLNGERVAPDFKVALLPTLYVIGTEGQVLHASVGFDPALERKIGGLIQGHLGAE